MVRQTESGLAELGGSRRQGVDLDARLDLDPDLLKLLRGHGLLYDRLGEGELLHAYTPVLDTGFYVELLERRGGYDGYGSAGTHVRLAAQDATAG